MVIKLPVGINDKECGNECQWFDGDEIKCLLFVEKLEYDGTVVRCQRCKDATLYIEMCEKMGG